MEEFTFDLQRFDDTVISAGQSAVISITSGSSTEPKTITAGAGNAITIKPIVADNVTTGAAISLSSTSNGFTVKDDDTNEYKYELTKIGSNGINISIGSGSSATVDSIDDGDTFVINNIHFTRDSNGLFSGSYNNSNYTSDKVILGSSTSSVALKGTIPTDLSNWYEIREVDSGTLSISSASAFSVSSGGGKGVIAADTDADLIKFYAELSRPNVADYKYLISGTPSLVSGSTDTLSSIFLASSVVSGGVAFTNDFAGSLSPSLSIRAGTNIFHVESSDSYFILSAKDNSSAFLDEHATGVSLISGS